MARERNQSAATRQVLRPMRGNRDGPRQIEMLEFRKFVRKRLTVHVIPATSEVSSGGVVRDVGRRHVAFAVASLPSNPSLLALPHQSASLRSRETRFVEARQTRAVNRLGSSENLKVLRLASAIATLVFMTLEVQASAPEHLTPEILMTWRRMTSGRTSREEEEEAEEAAVSGLGLGAVFRPADSEIRAFLAGDSIRVDEVL